MRKVRSSSTNGFSRMGAGSPDRLGNRKWRSRHALLLFLGLLTGGVLLSSLTFMVQQPTDSTTAEPLTRLHFHMGGQIAPSTDSNSQPDAPPASRKQTAERHRWRWKQPSSEEQQQHAAAAQQQTARSSSRKEASLTSLLPALRKATRAVSVPAAAASVTFTALPTPALLAAQPEDVSIILASGQQDSKQQQKQQAKTAAAAGPPADLQPGVDPVDGTSVYIKRRGVQPVRLEHPLWWHGPMWSGSGYGSEAVNYVLSLLRTGRLAPADIWAYHHGDGFNDVVVKSMSNADRTELEYLQSMPVKYRHTRSAVVVCHSVPTNWAFPEPMHMMGAQCPPNPKEFAWVYSVGRTMFETDRLPAVFVPRLNALQEIWVPSEWQKQSFIASGVDATKLVVVPEGVNTSLYDPSLYKPMSLRDRAELVFGQHWEAKLGQQAAAAMASGSYTPRRSLLADASQSKSPAEHSTAALAAAAGQNAGADRAGSKQPGGLPQQQPQQQQEAAPRQQQHQGGSAGPNGSNSSSGGSSGSSGGSTGNSGSTGGNSGSTSGNSGSTSGNSGSTSGNRRSTGSSSGAGGNGVRRPFRFISTFKWEQRKGWDILLEAYLTAFSAHDDVELYILTQPFASSGSSFKDKMQSWAERLNIKHPSTGGSSSSKGHGRSLQGHTPQAKQQPYSMSEDAHAHAWGDSAWQPTDQHSEDAVITDQAAWSAHVGDVVQQIQEFAGQLHKRGLQEATENSLAGSAGAAQTAPSAVHGMVSGHTQVQQHHDAGDQTVTVTGVHRQLPATVLQASPATAAQHAFSAVHAGQTPVQRRQLLQASSVRAAGFSTQQHPPSFTKTVPETAREAEARLSGERAAAKAAVIRDSVRRKGAERYPTLYVVNSHISDADFPRFYKTGDAFVLPTRGEGWGRPHVESMSMGLPVFSTNWSGITAYLDESVGYPIKIDGLVPVAGGSDTMWWFRGLKWAQPSLQHLVHLMHHVFHNREEAAAKGAAARARMIERYGPEAIADVLVKELQRIQDKVP